MGLSDQDRLTIVCPICNHADTQTVKTLREAIDPLCEICKGFLSEAITKEFVRQGLMPPPVKRV